MTQECSTWVAQLPGVMVHIIEVPNVALLPRGNKWAATKWVYSDPQMWTLPCQVDRPHNYPPFKNPNLWPTCKVRKISFKITFLFEIPLHCLLICCISCLKLCPFPNCFQFFRFFLYFFCPRYLELASFVVPSNNLASCHKYRTCRNSCVCRLERDGTGMVKMAKMGRTLCARPHTRGSLYTCGCSLKVLWSLVCKTLRLRQSR